MSVETTHRDVSRMMVSVRSSDPPLAELFRPVNDCNLSGNTMFGCSTLYKPAITMHEDLVLFGDYQFHFKQKSILSIKINMINPQVCVYSAVFAGKSSQPKSLEYCTFAFTEL